jgi:type I restriction enzyme M protein
MLTEAERRIRELNPSAHVHLFGQEVNDESYAICRSDLLMSGEDAANIRLANTLTTDAFGDRRFDYVLANPPYGKDWKTEQAQVRAEHRTLGFAGRYGAGLPPTSDGQLLFLQHMLAKLRPAEDGGGRVGVVMNGSPLFSGDAGSGPSEVRRWICEHDLLDAIVALPDQLFYNTGIYTYVWILSNAKPPERAGHALLIDARRMYAKMRKSLGNKRNELTDAHIAEITHLYESYAETEHAKVVPTTTFGFRKITVERPLRLRWEVS